MRVVIPHPQKLDATCILNFWHSDGHVMIIVLICNFLIIRGWTSVHMFIAHSYLLLRKILAYVFCPLVWYKCIVLTHLQSFFIYSGYQSFAGLVCYKYLLLGYGLSFHSTLSCDEWVLNSNIVKFINLVFTTCMLHDFKVMKHSSILNIF